jgi:hypothetical protein
MQAGICPQINSVNFAGDCFAPAKDLIGQSADETSEKFSQTENGQ